MRADSAVNRLPRQTDPDATHACSAAVQAVRVGHATGIPGAWKGPTGFERPDIAALEARAEGRAFSDARFVGCVYQLNVLPPRLRFPY